MKKRSTEADVPRAQTPEPAKQIRSAVPVQYRPLHKYLDGRFADTLVLTFSEIEDLLGFTLPDLARQEAGWWSNGEAGIAPQAQSHSWIQASRTAKPNMTAQTVVFERH